MMDANRRFTILTFPQFYDGNVLRTNIVFLPRNQNPLMPAIEGEPPIPDAAPFADARLAFVARSISGLAGLPTPAAARPPVGIVTGAPANARRLFEALANQFAITNKGAQNTNLNVNNFPGRAPDPVAVENSVRKYLPVTYRSAFNFVAPRTKNAVTDDSYHCAVRDAAPKPGFKKSPEAISWGEVFAHALRQPLLAESLGIIYRTDIPLDASVFVNGGWLFIEFADDSDYTAQQNADDTFVRGYAARIPPLEAGQSRSVFAPIQFPVLAAAAPGNYDQIFIEAAEYDEGFAKVVHAFQPVSQNLLLEQADGFHPTHEAGIRLGWDDEQILIWYIRQLATDESVGPKQRIDAPLGASGYSIDVREQRVPANAWQSLNLVSSVQPLAVIDPATEDVITLGNFTHRELPYHVYPAQLDGDPAKSYWLPMYFATWSGHSIVLPDADAAAIYQHGDVKPEPSTNVTKPPANDLNRIYTPDPPPPTLVYGRIYEFRTRLKDLSGGGPDVGTNPAHQTASQVATCHFKRFVAPSAIRIADLPVNNDDAFFAADALKLRRPLLGYPAVVFTGRYADPIALLKQASEDMVGTEAFGISDPDVESVEITVEVQTLKMDSLMSVSGRESYINFYTTTRKFPTASPTFDDQLSVPLEFRDCKVLKFGDPADLGDLGVTQAELDGMEQLVLPTARTIRLTVRAVCGKKANYYGLERDDHEFNTRYGRTVQFQLYRPSADERSLFAGANLVDMIRGIYLQPDPTSIFDGNPASILLGKEAEKAADIVQRLAQRLGLESRGLTLVGKKGQRVQFGCSNRIRHTLSPDNSSITFASKGDLANHWICGITADIDRDWTWDALQDRSLVIERRKRFREDDEAAETDTTEVGDIEIKRTAPYGALQDPDRGRTTIVFIDAVDAKNERTQPPPHGKEPRFPDLITLSYRIRMQFKPAHAAQHDADLTLPLLLPITTPPAQVPRIVSAGIALSPYKHNATYSETEPRRRYLWVEFEEPVRDRKDTYFARALAYAQDQLISNNHPDLLIVPEEPALPIDPEYIRVITSNQPNDDAGLDAMQPMEKATDSDRFYLLPLPPALHPDSSEMFGLFTYEFRVGHFRYTDKTAHHAQGEAVWCTAQARFGRPLRVTGLQHPAPTLTCTANRDEEKLYVSAPYAVAVHNGRNVTADPPRTQLWCLLYAQVKQADNREFRNILLDDRMLDPNVRVEHDKQVNWSAVYTDAERATLRGAAFRNFSNDVNYARFRHVFQLADPTTVNKDATKYGTAIWSNPEVTQLLTRYGLPPDSPLSVLCVEILPHITNIYEHVTPLHKAGVRSQLRTTVGGTAFPSEGVLQEGLSARMLASRAVVIEQPRPLTSQLGQYRILRTSPLSEVPFVCCPDCEP